MSRSGQRGVTLLELLVSLLTGSVVLSALASSVFSMVRVVQDVGIAEATDSKAEAILDMMLTDIRHAGIGNPLYQADFRIGANGIGGAALPILRRARRRVLSVRTMRGVSTLLAAPFDTTAGNRTLSLFPNNEVVPGDIIYLTDMTAGGSAGLMGEVASFLPDEVTIGSRFTSTAGVQFPVGSLVTFASEVQYRSRNRFRGIIRTENGDRLQLTTRGEFTLRYLDSDGLVIRPPLSLAEIRDELARVEVSVAIGSQTARADGQTYISYRTQTVAIPALVNMR